MTIPVQFISRLAIPLVVTALLFSEQYGPDQVKLYDQIQRASDLVLHQARGEGQGPTENFDYIIIGGGSAGAVLANRLTKSGENTVLLLEGGGDPNPLSDIPLARRHVQANSELSVTYQSVPQQNSCLASGKCFHPRAITLGGCSVINGALYNRCNYNDFDSWANFTGDSFWSFDNVVEAFKRIESYHGFFEDTPGPNHGTDGEVYVGKMDYIPGSDVLLDALAEQGVPTGDLNSGLFPFGYSKIDYNVKEGLRQSTFQAFLEPVLDRTNLVVYRYAWASKVHLDAAKKATGVTYQRHGQTRFVAANKEIIISAGVYESPKLLMLSGIGPSAHLAQHGIATVLDLPAVGDYLQDHIAIGGRSHAFSLNRTFGQTEILTNATLAQFIANGTGPLNAFEFGPAYAPQIAMGYVPSTYYNDLSWPDIQTYVHEELIAADGLPVDEHFYIDHALMRPDSHGTVRLASTNPEDHPLIDPKFFEDPNDLERLVDGIEYTSNLFLNAPMLQAIEIKWSDSVQLDPACTAHTFPTRNYWKCLIQQRSSTHFHPTSTCRMGPNKDVAVVDSKLRVFGATGLRVVDASVMPFVPSGNTNFPTMAIGDLASQLILEA